MKPFNLFESKKQTFPVVFCSPHSGSYYPKNFLKQSLLNETEIRASEDSYIDDLFSAVKDYDLDFLTANYPRAFVDLNRQPYELDPTMFYDQLPDYVNTKSERVKVGLGTIAKLVDDDKEIYKKKHYFSDIYDRIQSYYMPYHNQLRQKVLSIQEKHGCCLIIDCHSMHSVGRKFDSDTGKLRPDIILGNRHGYSCNEDILKIFLNIFRSLGYRVSCNNPYAGANNVEYYPNLKNKIQVIQIEINRNLYINEVSRDKTSNYNILKDSLSNFIELLLQQSLKVMINSVNESKI